MKYLKITSEGFEAHVDDNLHVVRSFGPKEHVSPLQERVKLIGIPETYSPIQVGLAKLARILETVNPGFTVEVVYEDDSPSEHGPQVVY